MSAPPTPQTGLPRRALLMSFWIGTAAVAAGMGAGLAFELGRSASPPDLRSDALSEARRLLYQGRAGEAAARFTAAAAVTPADPAAQLGLAQARLESGDRPGAIAALRSLLRYHPRLAAAHARLGALLAEEGRESEARRHLDQALALDPRQDEARRRALARLRGGRP